METVNENVNTIEGVKEELIENVVEESAEENKVDIAAIVEMFGLTPNCKLSKKKSKILLAISQAEQANEFELCQMLDMKPSKFEERMTKLVECGLVEFCVEDKTYALSELAKKYIAKTKEDIKNEKKFKKFLNSMNNDEMNAFLKLCDQFKYVED